MSAETKSKSNKPTGPRPAKYTYELEKQVRYGGGIVSFSCFHNQKMPNTMVLMYFPGVQNDQKYLLCQLLKTYCAESRCGVCIDVNLSRVSLVHGFNSILFICPERFIVQNIIHIYKFLMTRSLSITESKNILKGDYNILAKELRNFTIYMTGKTKAFIKQLEEGGSKPSRLVTLLNAVKPSNTRKFIMNNFDYQKKQRERTLFADSVENKKPPIIEQFYLSIILSEIPFMFNNGNIVLLNVEDMERVKAILALPRKQNEASVKSFLRQSGPYTSLIEQNPEKKLKKFKSQYMLHFMLMLLKSGEMLRNNDRRLVTDFDHEKFVSALMRYNSRRFRVAHRTEGEEKEVNE